MKAHTVKTHFCNQVWDWANNANRLVTWLDVTVRGQLWDQTSHTLLCTSQIRLHIHYVLHRSDITDFSRCLMHVSVKISSLFVHRFDRRAVIAVVSTMLKWVTEHMNANSPNIQRAKSLSGCSTEFKKRVWTGGWGPASTVDCSRNAPVAFHPHPPP